MTGPTPVTLLVCSLCGTDWQRHLLYAAERVGNEYYGDHGPPVVSDRDVTPYECVQALKYEHQGPMGPAGPMGPMGHSAPPRV